MNKWDVIIIGGGPAGIFTACQLDRDLRVLIIEKNEQLGKKLLVSGSGQCNLTHDGSIMDFFERFNKKGRYVRRALSLFTNENLQTYFTSRGLRLITREDGKVFPESLQSQHILKILSDELEKLNRSVEFKSTVTDIKYSDGVFAVTTDEKIHRSKVVVVATGGITYPSLGSSGDGQRFAKQFGHKIIPMKGGLSPVVSKEVKENDLSGITLKKITLNVHRVNRKVGTYTGDLLFTHKGLSGPVIIDHSRDFEAQDELRVDLGIRIDQLDEKKALINALKKYVPIRLAAYILGCSEIPEKALLKSISKSQLKSLERNLHALNFLIDIIGQSNNSMVTCGGVGFEDVNMKTLESRLVEGLYFVGEVLDIDGESGGYNIQAAFSTGALVAHGINGSFKS
jgi:hypothetical protein